MGKYTLKLDEVIEGNSDPSLESWERDEASKYWIHRTMLFDYLYFHHKTDFGSPDFSLSHVLYFFLQMGISVCL